MKDLKKEAQTDIALLNDFKSDVIESAILEEKDLSAILKSPENILSQSGSIDAQKIAFIENFRETLPNILSLLNWRGVASIDPGSTIRDIISGEISESDIQELLKIRDEMREIQELILNMISNISKNARLSFPTMLREFLNVIPPEEFAEQRKNMERILEMLSTPIGDFVIGTDALNLINNLLAKFAQVIGIYLKWIDYELDTFLQPQVMPLSDIRQISDGTKKVLEFFNENPSIIQITQLILLIISLILSH